MRRCLKTSKPKQLKPWQIAVAEIGIGTSRRHLTAALELHWRVALCIGRDKGRSQHEPRRRLARMAPLDIRFSLMHY